MNYEISINIEGVSDEIEAQLLATLRTDQVQSVNRSFSLSIEENQQLIGGLTAGTSYGWLLVKTLWVKEEYRHSGMGGGLLKKAEQMAIEAGCHGAWLDTSSRAAREFYLRRGYREFGVLANRPDQYPSEHRRWFMQKMLDLP